MSRDLASLFNLVVQPTMEQNAALPAVSKNLSFDDIADFVEERERIQRKLESLREAEPKTDFSDFANHVFFDSAMSKFDIAKDKILNQYPFNGSSEEKDLFTISGSYYENYVAEQWPHYVGYGFLSGGQVISASDDQGKLYLAPSQSLYITARIAPAIAGINNKILSVLSGGQASHQYGYTLTTTNTLATFTIYSGSSQWPYTALFTTSSITNRFATLGVIYDAGQQKISMWLDASKKSVASFTPSTAIPTFGPAQIAVGTNYTGSIAEIRVLHTASELFHVKNFSRPITSEDYVKLNYRFNEGITGIPQLDATVIDYSKSKLHARWMQYGPNCRRSGSTNLSDPGDLILYPMQPDVMAYTGSQETAAEIYDAVNRNYIMRLLPDDLLIDDQNEQGLLSTFALAMARYFDDLKMYFDQFDNLRITNYSDLNEAPDLMLPLMKNYFGWKVTDHFSDSEPLQFLFGEGVLPTGSLDTPLLEIKNQFWRRILNNLPYLYKTKGKRDNLDSFFNVLGINPQLINLKEYGSVFKSTIDDEYIAKEKNTYFLRMSGSDCLKTPPLNTSGAGGWTIESVIQFPNGAEVNDPIDVFSLYQSSSYSIVFGIVDANDPTVGYLAFRSGPADINTDTTYNLPLFGGQFSHVSLKDDGFGNQVLGVRQVNQGQFVLRWVQTQSGSALGFHSGSTSAIFGHDATLGLPTTSNTHLLGQARVWNRALSEQDLDAHALDYENIADSDALASGSGLLVHYACNENRQTNSSGTLVLLDQSRNNYSGTLQSSYFGSNPYVSELIDYNFLSPTFDLKWTQNKVRIRNKTKLDLSDLANDNNQVALEFNLTDALNEDISKIFSTMDAMNNIIGAPINKYRDHYHDLESYREMYFQRLTDSLHFTKFFKLFRWFDKKLAISIKQLLPARTDFIGGEFVVESHMLERNKYQYLYPIFHTPKDIDGGDVAVGKMASSLQRTLTASSPFRGTTVRSIQDSPRRKLTHRPTSVEIDAAIMPRFRNVTLADYIRAGDSPYAKFSATSSLIVTPDFTNPSNYTQQSAWVSYANGTVTAFTSDGAGIWGYPYQQVVSGSVVTGSYIAFCSSSIGIDVFLQDGDGNSIGDSVHVNLVGGVSQPVSLFAQLDPGQSNFVALQTNMPHDQTMTARNMVLAPLLQASSPKYSISSDDADATDLPNASLNYAKEGARRAYDSSLARARGQVIDPQITSGLWGANGFVFSNIDSNDSESHYFGTKKSMEMRIIGTISGSSSFTCGPGAQTQSLPQMQLTDKNGVALNVSSAFCFPDWGSVSQKVGAVMSFEVSCSSNVGNNGLQTTDFYFQYADNNTAAWPLLFVNPALNRGYVLPYSARRPVTNSPGWFKYTMYLRSGLETAFALSSSLANSNQFAGWRISMANTTAKYAFRKLRLDYYQPLTDAGVNYFQKLGNSHTKKIQSYVAPGLLKPSVSTGVMPSGSFFQVKNTVMGRQFSPSTYVVQGKSNLLYGINVSGTLFSVSNDYGKTVLRSSALPTVYPAFAFDFIGEKLAYALAVSGSNMTVYKSTDTCVTWKQVVTVGGVVFPYSPVIYKGGVYFSLNDQIAWVDATGTFDGQLLDFYLGKLVIDNKGTFWGIDFNNPTAGVYRSTDEGLNWTQVFSGSTTTVSDFAIAADGWAYIAATSRSNPNFTTVLSSSTGGPMTYGVGKPVAPTQVLGSAGGILTTDNRGNVYYSLSTNNSDVTPWTVWRSGDHGRTWAVLADFPSGSAVSLGTMQVSPDDETFITTGFGYDAKSGYSDPNYTYTYLARIGTLENNQVTYGPSTLATSQQFVSSSVSGNLVYGYKLGNISEFPHYGGLFQMRNIVLGTQNVGKIGSGIDNVVEVTHVGSVVNVLWPNQSTLTAPVMGFGESSIGQSPGNLTTEFTYGVPFDVTGYDHMSLYCYALKQAVGTQDDIIVKIQRRPLLSVGFATEQTVEYTVSGSFTEARYRDIHHTKAVNYASVNGAEVSYVIDVPLVNVREVRVGARHKFGQDTPNQNFLVWARFIDSKTET